MVAASGLTLFGNLRSVLSAILMPSPLSAAWHVLLLSALLGDVVGIVELQRDAVGAVVGLQAGEIGLRRRLGSEEVHQAVLLLDAGAEMSTAPAAADGSATAAAAANHPASASVTAAAASEPRAAAGHVRRAPAAIGTAAHAATAARQAARPHRTALTRRAGAL